MLLLAWLLNSSGKLDQFEKYVDQVFVLAGLRGRQTGGGGRPEIPTADAVNSRFHGALRRIPA